MCFSPPPIRVGVREDCIQYGCFCQYMLMFAVILAKYLVSFLSPDIRVLRVTRKVRFVAA